MRDNAEHCHEEPPRGILQVQALPALAVDRDGDDLHILTGRWCTGAGCTLVKIGMQEVGMDDKAYRERLGGTEAPAAQAGGGFEILAITAGEGNGWRFDAPVLRESLGLWDGVECFVDHAWRQRSVRDLAGVLVDPRWDAGRQGVCCTLRVVGPSGEVLRNLGEDLSPRPLLRCGEGESKVAANVGADTPADNKYPRVGFSADVVFAAEGRVVTKILKVNSVDLVVYPARGGRFVNRLSESSQSVEGQIGSSRSGSSRSGNSLSVNGQLGSSGQDNMLSEAVVHGVFEDLNGGNGMTEMNEEGVVAQESAGEQEQLRAQMCEYVLESGLAAARLPRPVAERVRKQFSGRAFAPVELNAAIDDARAMVSELTGPGAVMGVSASLAERRGSGNSAGGRISGMFSGADQFSAAIHDLLGAERPDDLKGARSARLSGIRELYTLMTGDVDFSGGYDGTRAQFATSADLPNVLKDAMNRLIFQEWQELGRSGYRWWEPVVAVEHFNNLQQITGVLVGEVNVLPQVNEGAAYTALGVSDSGETGSWTKYGGYIGLTLEMFERDETHKLRQYPRKLASAGLRRISALVGSIFTANSGAGPAMADGLAVFHTDRNNLGSAALASASWEAASRAIYEQPMLVKAGDTPPVLALDAKYLLAPRALRLTGANILYPSFAHEANIFSENMQRGELGDVITVPEFSDATDWAAVADPRLAPGIVVGERFGLLPEIILADNQAQGALFTNDEIRMKARHYLAVFVADYRPLYKANVVG